jgi:hypothetical protein
MSKVPLYMVVMVGPPPVEVMGSPLVQVPVFHKAFTDGNTRMGIPPLFRF